MRTSATYHLLAKFNKQVLDRLNLIKPALLAVSLASFGVVAQAPLDVRVALIIGNAAYVNVPVLANSTNDAKSIANIMKKLGFKVFDVIDGDKASMERAIDQMKDQLKGQQAVAMLYYAGHGLQLDWRNYMVPVDAKLNSSADVPKQTIDIERVITTFKNANTRMNIIVLDACRDNPFADKASGKGLAQLDAPPGTYLAFATSPGNVAEDGDVSSGNGLFTEFLIKELQKPARIEDVFKRVRLQVRQKSQGRQIPWDSSSLEDDFAFNDGVKHTFNPEDLIREAREAKEKEERLRAEVEAAKKREIEIAQQKEQEKIRLAQEQKRRQQEAEIQRQRDIEIAQQRELERQKLAEAQKIKEIQERQKAEAESRDRERQLALAAEEQKRKAQEAEQARMRAEAEAKERENQLAIAAEAEKKKAQEATQALDRAKLAEVQRLKDLEQARAQAELEARLRKESADKQFEIQKADWDKIKDSKNVDDFYAFLNKYPSGYITEQAQFAVEQLQKAKITAQVDKDGFISSSKVARFRVGDEYVIAIKDNFNGREIKRYQIKVEKIENGLVYNSSTLGNEKTITTLDGATVKNINSNGVYEFDPPVPIQPGDEFQVGKRWTAQSIMTTNKRKQNRTDNIKITAAEEIEVIAGKFKVYKVEINSSQDNGNIIKNTYWFQPGIGIPIMKDRHVRRRNGDFLFNEKYELVSYSLGK